MTYEDAKIAAFKEFSRLCNLSQDELVILENKTICKPYGWILFFNTKRYIETANVVYALGGNGPVVVESTTGCITPLGTARPLEDEIDEYELSLKRRLARFDRRDRSAVS